jgi:hypothetical protein
MSKHNSSCMPRSNDLRGTITYIQQNNIESAAPLKPLNRAALEGLEPARTKAIDFF